MQKVHTASSTECISFPPSLTCTGAADDAVVNVGAAVDCDLQAVVGVMVLGRLIVRIELRQEK